MVARRGNIGDRGTFMSANDFATFTGTLDDRHLCHLLRRGAFGPSDALLEKLSGKSLDKVLDWLFEFDVENDPFDQMVDSLEGFVNLNRGDAVASYWFYRMLNTPRPLQERVALF